MQLKGSFLALASTLNLVASSAANLAERNTGSLTFDDRTFVNKGLVGFGRISGDAVDSYGESLGGFGSAIALKSFSKKKNGTYVFTLIGQPDRGHNTVTQTDYRARQHKFTLVFDPNQGSNTTENINSTYVSTTLYKLNPTTFRGDTNFTTGLDPTAVRPASGVQPDLPIAPSDNHISVDSEGLALVINTDYQWISDEYGPSIYYVSRSSGQIKYALKVPAAITPMQNGQTNFTSNAPPQSGRMPNQGFEGLTLDHNTKTLWACLQSATAQDGGLQGKNTNRYSRLLAYNVSNPIKAKLIGEYVVPLPQSSKGKTQATSEIHVIDSTTFLILARDGNGFGDTSSSSSFKSVDIISTKGATNIAGTQFDSPSTPIAPGGVLDSSITPVSYSSSFVNLIQPDQLAKFGLQNGGAFDRTLIASKLESLALAPVGDAANPDDYFLFVVSDNDFITANGSQAAEDESGNYVLQPYQDEYALQHGTADTQVFIYRVTLPGYAQKPLPN
ncbi:hypothetical protein OC845_000902 [Tilletia horrida]|nr:hypothetical protein OC845_000902 [Tilletia horrida]